MIRTKYYCPKCGINHFFDSNIGRKHQQAATIRVIEVTPINEPRKK